MLRIALTVAALGAATFFSTTDQAEASSVGIAPVGVTTVEVTANLGSLGLGGAPVGSATADGAVFSFPITGGSIDSGSGDALIEHDGSGVKLFALADASINVSVGNFLIDTMMQTVSGDVFGGSSGVTFFNFGTPGASGIPLLISSDLASALTSIFGAPDLTGAEFGLANTNPTVVPLPAGLPLLLAALGGLAALRRTEAT